MKMIFGLGNPGKEYINTRHNMGFIFVDNYLKGHDITISKKKFNAMYIETLISNERVFFVKPLSYMNLSGTVIKQFVDYYKVSLEDILIIHDDLDLPFGNIKIKYDSSSGGHNGIKNTIECLGTKRFTRVKVGISNDHSIDTRDYVTGLFNKEEQNKLLSINQIIDNIIDDFINNKSKEELMCKYNGAINENI